MEKDNMDGGLESDGIMDIREYPIISKLGEKYLVQKKKNLRIYPPPYIENLVNVYEVIEAVYLDMTDPDILESFEMNDKSFEIALKLVQKMHEMCLIIDEEMKSFLENPPQSCIKYVEEED